MSKIDKKSKKKNAPKNRKTLRKEKRKEKKQKKFEHYTNRKKPGKFVMNPNKLTEKLDQITSKTTNVPQKTKHVSPKATALDTQMVEIKKEKEVHKKLQKDMAKQRKKQLKEANLDEDRNIKQLEKQLKLNKRKNKSIPRSFASDGLDYLLEVCEPENVKSIAAAEQQFNDFNDEFEDDFALVTGKSKQTKNSNKKEDNADSDSSLDQSDEEDVKQDESDSDEFNIENSFNSEDDLTEEEGSNEPMDLLDDVEDSVEDKSEEENNKKRKKNNDGKSKKVKKTDNSDSNNEETVDSESEVGSVKEETWEDIYGRTRSKDGSVVSQKTEGKYIPPALRALKENNSNVDQKRAEKLARLKKQMKGLLNRLAESNMHSISSQIEDMYMANSRNDMNETLTQLIFEALIAPVTTPERLLLEYVLLITILHANIGTEVGAQFLQTVVNQFDELFKKDQPVENKELDNTVHIIAQLYNFKVFQSQLLYQILANLAARFEEKHVECILLVLKNVGFSLRKDDPVALKHLILDLQKKATTVTDNNSRVKYMLDILLAIKNNNVSKIPNYDTTYSEHLKKLLKSFVRKGNYVTQLNISLDDLLKADERGRWWIVGSAWTGTGDHKHEKHNNTDTGLTFSQKLLELARKQRMNTDTRRNIFCSLMTAENYLDAFEKLINLRLKNQQEREIIHVILHCSLQEKEYNPYYGLLTQKFCEYDRKYQMIIRCSIWDKLKTLTECSGRQISILARLLTYLFLNQGLPISILKVIEFSELDQITLRLIRQVLIGILLHDNEEISLAVFQKVATSPKLKMFRESLRLFIHHFLLRNLNTSSLSNEHKEMITSRAKLTEKTLTSSENKVKF